jgi:hypothetical protein
MVSGLLRGLIQSVSSLPGRCPNGKRSETRCRKDMPGEAADLRPVYSQVLRAAVAVFKPDDVVLAKVITRLHFN